jgi:hypothetical protein
LFSQTIVREIPGEMSDLPAISLLIAEEQGKDRKSGITEVGDYDASREKTCMPYGA